GERSIPIVAIQDVRTELRDVQIGIAVVVVIAHRHTHSIADVAQAGLFRNIDKLHLAGFLEHVAEEAISRFPASRRSGPRVGHGLLWFEYRPLNKKDVEVAVAIVVEQGHAGAHDLGQVELAGRSREVVEIETGLPGNVLEAASVRPGAARERRGEEERTKS